MNDQNRVAMQITTGAGLLAAMNVHCLRSAAAAYCCTDQPFPTAGGGGILNLGYWGVSIMAGRSYTLSLYTRSPEV